MPLHAHILSFTHNAVVLWLFRCVHLENQTKICRFLYFYESKQMSLTQDLKWSLEQWSALHYSLLLVSNWFVTLYFKLLHSACSVSLSSKHGHRCSRLLLYFISMAQKLHLMMCHSHGSVDVFHSNILTTWTWIFVKGMNCLFRVNGKIIAPDPKCLLRVYFAQE